MRKLLTYYLAMLLCLLTVCGSAASRPLKTVQHFELSRYMGKWYEIALLPNHFQKGCECTTAEYALTSKNTLSILNRCLKTNRKHYTEAHGKGWVPNENEKSQLKIRFIWPLSGDYWILYLQKNYQYALVGSPNHHYLWILSRKKTMQTKIYQKLINMAKINGFDTRQIKKTTQNCVN